MYFYGQYFVDAHYGWLDNFWQMFKMHSCSLSFVLRLFFFKFLFSFALTHEFAVSNSSDIIRYSNKRITFQMNDTEKKAPQESL